MAEEEVTEVSENTEVVEPEKEPTPDYEKQIAGLKNAASEERKKRQIAEQELERSRQESKPDPQPEPEPVKAETPDIDALLEQKLKEREEATRKQQSEQARAERVDSWRSTIDEAQQRYEDIDLSEGIELVGTELAKLGPVGIDLADDIIGSDKSWDIIAHLQQNPDELAKMKNMSATQMGRELGRLESKFSTGESVRRVSSAPDPIRPVGSKALADKDPDKMSPREYEAWAKERRGGQSHVR